jgi:hypothetical protein
MIGDDLMETEDGLRMTISATTRERYEELAISVKSSNIVRAIILRKTTIHIFWEPKF